jgi:hypothetical protein
VKRFVPGGLRTSAVVGTTLISINQFEAVFGNGDINWLKVGLTYLTPFIVFIYSVVSSEKTKGKEILPPH